MMNVPNILLIFSACCFVTINDKNQIKAYKHDIFNFKEPFLLIKASKIFFGKSPIKDFSWRWW